MKVKVLSYEAKNIFRNSISAIVVVHNKIETFLSNKTFAAPKNDSYKSTFLFASFDDN